MLIGGPLFKQTGVAAIAAVGLFVLVRPILYHYAWKKVGKDILLLVAGAMITLTPICVWYASMGTPLYYWPYSFALGPVFKLAGARSGIRRRYRAGSRRSRPLQAQEVQERR